MSRGVGVGNGDSNGSAGGGAAVTVAAALAVTVAAEAAERPLQIRDEVEALYTLCVCERTSTSWPLSTVHVAYLPGRASC